MILIADSSRDVIWFEMVVKDIFQIVRAFWIPILVFVVLVAFAKRKSALTSSRGFEVKQNAGGLPATQTKEDDHG